MSAQVRHHEAPARLITCRSPSPRNVLGRGVIWAMRLSCRWALSKGYTVLYVTNPATMKMIVTPLMASLPVATISEARLIRAKNMGEAHERARTWPAATRGPLWIVYVHA